jgi:hypothetical protein
MTKYVGAGFYGLQPPLWVSGAAQQAAWQWVTSPADKEVYQRNAATTGSTTDPADDVTNYVARSYERTVALQAAALAASGATPGQIATNATKSTFGALAVGTRTSVLSVTGRGALGYLMLWKGATGTTRVEIEVDGRNVLDQTDTYTASVALIALGYAATPGDGTNAVRTAVPDPAGVHFRRSLQVWVTNTATVSHASAFVAHHLRSVA